MGVCGRGMYVTHTYLTHTHTQCVYQKHQPPEGYRSKLIGGKISENTGSVLC